MMKIGIALGGYYKERMRKSNRSQQGGAEIQTGFLIEEFLKRGHEVVYFSYGDENRIEPVIQEDSLKVYQIKRPYKNIKALNYLNRYFLYKIIDMEGPDVLYQRGDFHFSDLISSYGKKKGIPVISGLSMEKHCYKEKVKLDLSFPLSILERFLRIRYYRRSNLIISQSVDQQKLFRRNFNMDSVVISNGHSIGGVPLEKEVPPLIVWIANIKPIKQPEIFIELARSCSDLDAKFVMVGRPMLGPDQVELEKKIEDVSNLEYRGELPLPEAEDLISRASILVNTSESEGFSNTFLQAWMSGIPVVSLNSDPDDVIKRNKIGFQSGSFQQMIEDVRSLINNEDMRKGIGKRARDYFIENHDIRVIADRHLSQFHMLLNRDRKVG